MKFSQQRFISNDVTLMPVDRLTLILGQARDLTRERPVLSGLEDLAETLALAHEWMSSSVPVVLFKELKRLTDGLALDPLYNEPSVPSHKGREFVRGVQLHAHATYSDPEFKHDKTGQQLNQPITIYENLLDLFLNDYYPEVGDEIIHLGRPFQITTVFFPVNALFLHTGMPIYVASTAEIWRHGDGKVPISLAKAGLPAPPPDPATVLLRNRLQLKGAGAPAG